MGKLVKGSRWMSRANRARVVEVLGLEGTAVCYRVVETRELASHSRTGGKGDIRVVDAQGFLWSYRPYRPL